MNRNNSSLPAGDSVVGESNLEAIESIVLTIGKIGGGELPPMNAALFNNIDLSVSGLTPLLEEDGFESGELNAILQAASLVGNNWYEQEFAKSAGDSVRPRGLALVSPGEMATLISDMDTVLRHALHNGQAVTLYNRMIGVGELTSNPNVRIGAELVRRALRDSYNNETELTTSIIPIQFDESNLQLDARYGKLDSLVRTISAIGVREMSLVSDTTKSPFTQIDLETDRVTLQLGEKGFAVGELGAILKGASFVSNNRRERRVAQAAGSILSPRGPELVTDTHAAQLMSALIGELELVLTDDSLAAALLNEISKVDNLTSVPDVRAGAMLVQTLLSDLITSTEDLDISLSESAM